MSDTTRLQLDMLPQPDDSTCGPTCLHAVYRYYGDHVPLQQVIDETRMIDTGGTLAVLLGCHALRRGYSATIFTYNLSVFDPTWFELEPEFLRRKLTLQAEVKNDPRLRAATEGYLEFLRLGGWFQFEDLTSRLIRQHLTASKPMLTGLSATYLYRCSREFGPEDNYDDIRGVPMGHFIVICGYDKHTRRVLIADPLADNPAFKEPLYEVPMARLVTAILLGVLTYDANLLVIEPRHNTDAPPDAPGAGQDAC